MSERNSTSAAAEQNATESWHVYSEADTLQRLNVGESGLTGKEAAERLMRFGRNRLPEKKPATFIQIFARQFINPLIYVLAVAACLATVFKVWAEIGHKADP